MRENRQLTKAKSAKNDEFYTQYNDIQKEVNAYLDFNPDTFRGKTVLLPCDDPEWSKFTRFFAENFERLGLKKLISTSYAAASKKVKAFYQPTLFETESPQFDKKKTEVRGKIFVLDHDTNANGRVDLDDLEWRYLEGDGDFSSQEVRKLRDEADIIVTNPPFSLFREYIALMMEHEKQFLVIGNMNAVTYREIFPLIRDNKVWLGNKAGHFWFKVPEHYEEKATDFKIDENGQKWRRMGNICWFTNLDIEKRHEEMTLFRHYTPEEYPKYDNYDAIDVKKTTDIPCDYFGIMGVPITFMQYHNPSQFDLVGEFNHGQDSEFDLAVPCVNGKVGFKRIAIRRKK